MGSGSSMEESASMVTARLRQHLLEVRPPRQINTEILMRRLLAGESCDLTPSLIHCHLSCVVVHCYYCWHAAVGTRGSRT